MTKSLKYGRRAKYYTMKTVQPIRDEKKIEAMKRILKGKSLRVTGSVDGENIINSNLIRDTICI